MVFVDGFNLYHGIHDDSGRRNLWLDLVMLARELRPLPQLVGVRYFTAQVLNDPGAQSRQSHYVSALKSRYPNLVEVVEGRYQTKELKCRKCGGTWMSHEEKETDVNLALSIVVNALQNTFDSALIISADSDVAPAVRQVKSLTTGKFIAAAFPPKRHSAELKQLMPASFNIGPAKIRKAQLPDKFKAAGVEFNRPVKWS